MSFPFIGAWWIIPWEYGGKKGKKLDLINHWNVLTGNPRYILEPTCFYFSQIWRQVPTKLDFILTVYQALSWSYHVLECRIILNIWILPVPSLGFPGLYVLGLFMLSWSSLLNDVQPYILMMICLRKSHIAHVWISHAQHG